MKVELEVLAYATIKRKKPWPVIRWIGKQKESLLLLDETRVSVLYIPSGKTKRNIPKLSPLIEESLVVNTTPNGYYLAGLLKSGDIFLWNKDKDIIKTICGLSKLIALTSLLTEKCCLFVSDDCSKVLLMVGYDQFYVWKSSESQSVFNGSSVVLPGAWNCVTVPDNIIIPSTDCLEISTTGIFYNNQVCGCCCLWSVVFNHGTSVCVTTLLIRFPSTQEMLTENCPSIHVEWCCIQYPVDKINAGCEPINSRGAYVTCYSNDGQLLAVGVNQRCPSNSAMLFISPLTETVLVSELRGCGLKHPEKQTGRQYWIKDMVWTVDNLFLACILNNGSVALLSRLGEPVAIHVSGCSIDMGPNYYLPLHPLVQVQSGNRGQSITDHISFMNDPMSQKFSVASHPSLPILLFSDGYNVTAIQLPAELTFTSYMRDLILESTKHLEVLKSQGNLDMTLVNAYNLSLTQTKSRSENGTSSNQRLKKFLKNLKDAEESFNGSDVSELSLLLDEEYQYGGDLSSGKIVFGDDEEKLATLDKSLYLEGNPALLKHFLQAKLNLFTVWKMAASCTENWTSNMEIIVKHGVKNVYKMFMLMINSPSVTDALSTQYSTAQNGCLVNVITIYRQLLDVLQFDSLEQHLIPATLQLAHKTIALILNNKTINQSDPRFKTLSGCYMLLKFTEKIMNRNYIWLPQNLVEKGVSPLSFLDRPDQYIPSVQTPSEDITTQLQIPSDQLAARRLTATWRLLYQALLDYRRDKTVSEADLQQSQLLVNAIHKTLNMVVSDSPTKPQQINQGDVFSLDGQYTQALDVWLQQYRNLHGTGGYHKAAKLLHSLLYTFLLRGELLAAIEFIDDLILKANKGNQTLNPGESRQALMTLITTTMRTQSSNVYDEVPCIKDKGVRLVVQTMARFMALYFSNQSLYIFPPHNPQALPSVHFTTPVINNRIIPQYQEEISQIIRYENLSDIWTVERTLEYLLLTGLVCEATWFADKMGDWKASYLLSVACEQHRLTAVSLYTKPRKPLSLPEHLKPVVILEKKLSILLGNSEDGSESDTVHITNATDLDQLSLTIKELLMAGIMCKVEVAPWLLLQLINKLKRLVRNLHPLVPSDFYLPSPPLYCPQPTPSRQHSQPPGVEKEMRLREKISSLIQLVLVVYRGCHLSLPCMTWYTQHLVQIQDKAKQFRANTEGPCLEVPMILQQYLSQPSHLSQYQDHPSTHTVLSTFRDFTTLLWLLHVRDKLSLKLRQKEKYLEKMYLNRTQDEASDEEEQQKWQQEIFTTLQWAVHLLSFSHYLPDSLCIYKILLSLLMELSPSEDTADIMAEHYYDNENLDPEIQEKLEKILSQWEAIIVTPEDDGKSARMSQDDSGTDVRKSVTFYRASPRGKSLSTYFSKQCHAVTKVLKKKAKKFGSYEEFIFSNFEETDNIYLHVGSRQFETKQSYFEFLDTFAAVSFEKLLELERSVSRPRDLPLLGVFTDAIISRELAVFSEKTFQNAEKKKYSLLVLSSTRSSCRSSPAFARSDSIITQRYNSNFSLNQESPYSKSQGLFRSKSVVEGKETKTSPVKRYHSEGTGLDVIVEDSPSKNLFSPRSQKNLSQQNMSNLASKFSQSEDALYKPVMDENNSWSLDVNFGRKYRLLQLLLEWLEVWCRKYHTFGFINEDTYDIHPTVKIQIPAQLILLSLWLLEYKYNPNAAALQDVGEGFIGETQANEKKSAKKKLHYSEESKIKNTKTRAITQLPKRSNSPSVRNSQEGGVNLSTFDEDGIRNAYQSILEGDHESSSISVSSLLSDELDGELKQTLSVIRGTGSPTKDDITLLNNRVYPDSSPDRGTASPNTSTPVSRSRTKQRFKHTTSSTSLQSLSSRRSTLQESLNERIAGIGNYESSSLRDSRNSSLERSSILKQSLTSSLERSTSPRNTKLHTVMNSRSLSPQLSVRVSRPRSHSPEKGHRNQQTGQIGPRSHSPEFKGHRNQQTGQIRTRSRSPEFKGHRNQQTGQIHTRSRSPEVKGHRYEQTGQRGHVSRRDAQQDSGHFDSGSNSSIASQLQNIVRSEMRRIMEVQHKSLMAMMGAIDSDSSYAQDADNIQRRNRHDRHQSTSPDRNLSPSLNRHHSASPDRHRSLSPQQRQRHYGSKTSVADHSMKLHDLEQSLPGRNTKVDRALQELKNLQNQSSPTKPQSDSKKMFLSGKENYGLPLLGLDGGRFIEPGVNQAQVNQVNIIPRFLRIAAEKDSEQPHFFLPQIQQAWAKSSPAEHPKQPMKLLKLQESSYSYFKNPPNQKQGTSPSVFSIRENLPRAQHQNAASMQPVNIQRFPAQNFNHKFGIPLLHLEQHKTPYLELGKEAQFGKLLDPHEALSPDQLLQQVEQQKEELRKQHEDEKAEIIQEVNKQISHVQQSKTTRKVKVKSPPRKPSEQNKEIINEEEESEEESESDNDQSEEIDDGFALKPGQFDSHLRLEEILGPGADTDTRFQYLLALKMKQERLKKKKKVDFSTMTNEMIEAIAETDPIEESVRTAEAWTSITKDTGCDPIHEAVIEYNKLQGNNIIPPDIYLKLGYNDGQTQDEERGRSYLNVVDIRASTVFKDIPERDEHIDFQPTSLPPSSDQDLEAVEELLREKLKPVPAEKRYGYDAVTAKMLDRKNRSESDSYLGYVPRESVRYSKTNLIKRLKEMNEQVEAIDAMSLNIEQDFESSKRIMTTLQRLEEVNQPQLTERDMEEEDLLTQQSLDEKLTPKSSVKSPTASSRVSSHKSPVHKNKQINEDVRISGMSDISDIIGEVLLEGGVDLQEAGLSPTEADMLKHRARTRQVISGSTGIEKLEELIQQTDAAKDNDEKKRILHKWMTERRLVKNEEYRHRLDRLREMEINPYRPQTAYDATLTGRELVNQTKERSEIRNIQKEEFMRQRIVETERLMGDILVEKSPASGRQPLSPKRTTSKPTLASKFGTTKTVKKGTMPKKGSLQSILKTTQFKRKAKEWENLRPRPSSLYTKWRVDGRAPGAVAADQQATLLQKKAEENERKYREEERRLKEERLAEITAKYNIESIDEFIPSVSISDDLMEYTKQVAERESMDNLNQSPDVQYREYKPKPFTQIVKLQRPEITRKDVDKRYTESYTDRLASLSPRDHKPDFTTARSYTRTTSTPAPEKSPPKQDIGGVRRVKTYTERLQEMKPTQKYTTPIVSKQYTDTSLDHSIQYRKPKPSGPPNKPQTYVQQLQKINKQAPRAAVKRATRIPAKTFMRSHKPIHKPQTYVEKLKSINSSAPETLKRQTISQRTKTLQLGVAGKLTRSRPYRDPYHDLGDDELHSVLSSWSMDDDVKKLLYGDDASYNGGGMTSPDYQQSEGISDYYEAVMADQYTASVDPDELARIADGVSVDSGSVMSVIDWDVIDDLIATVHD